MEHVECSTICCSTNGPEKIEQYIYMYVYISYILIIQLWWWFTLLSSREYNKYNFTRHADCASNHHHGNGHHRHSNQCRNCASRKASIPTWGGGAPKKHHETFSQGSTSEETVLNGGQKIGKHWDSACRTMGRGNSNNMCLTYYDMEKLVETTPKIRECVLRIRNENSNWMAFSPKRTYFYTHNILHKKGTNTCSQWPPGEKKQGTYTNASGKQGPTHNCLPNTNCFPNTDNKKRVLETFCSVSSDPGHMALHLKGIVMWIPWWFMVTVSLEPAIISLG